MRATINRLQLATRLHIALWRRHGIRIDVSLVLHHRRYASEVLALCRASDDPALGALATRFEEAMSAESALTHIAVAARAARAELALLRPQTSHR